MNKNKGKPFFIVNFCDDCKTCVKLYMKTLYKVVQPFSNQKANLIIEWSSNYVKSSIPKIQGRHIIRGPNTDNAWNFIRFCIFYWGSDYGKATQRNCAPWDASPLGAKISARNKWE